MNLGVLQMKPFTCRANFPALLPLAVLAWLGAIHAAEDTTRHAFNVAAGNAETALKQFSAQSGQQVLVPSELVAGIRTSEVHGELTSRAALDRMFSGTRVVVAADETSGVFAIVRRSAKLRAGPPLNAAAIIVVGLATDEAQEQRFKNEADAARAGLAARGIPSGAITVVTTDQGTLVRREAILSAMRAVKPTLDETWLVLLGNVAPGRDGAPMFQVSGPRLSADDLAAAVGALPGKKFVVLATTRSGALLPALLPIPNVEAVAATASAGEINEPRFARMWAEALAENPEASFLALATDATGRVGDFYRENQLGQGEHAQLIDRAANQIVEVPEREPPAPSTPVRSP
jgi:hypothetical protein